MSLFILVLLAIVIYSVGLVAFILWIVKVVSEDARQQFDSFLNATKQRDSATAFAMLTPELQSKTDVVAFDQIFVNQTAPELSNYAGLSYNRVKMQGAQARLGGTLKGSGQAYSVHLIKRNNTWKIADFSIGNFQSSSLFRERRTDGIKEIAYSPEYSTPTPPKKRSNSRTIQLFIIAPLIVLLYVGGLVAFILWIVGLASEDAYKEFDNFVNAARQRDSIAAYTILSSEVQITTNLSSFESEFVNQIAPELSNYAGLDAGSTSVRNSVARLSGTLKGSGQPYSVRLINRDNKWKITGFSIGRYRVGVVF